MLLQTCASNKKTGGESFLLTNFMQTEFAKVLTTLFLLLKYEFEFSWLKSNFINTQVANRLYSFNQNYYIIIK